VTAPQSGPAISETKDTAAKRNDFIVDPSLMRLVTICKPLRVEAWHSNEPVF
jgi:hypothetical protein